MNTHKIHKIGKLVIFAIIFASTLNAYSQNSGIKYTYDESGNRIKRSPGSETGIVVIEKENDSFKLQIFPNPTTGLFNIDVINFDSKFQVEIFNMVGSSILNREYSEKTTSINISNYPAGVYLVKVTIDGVSRHGKIVKK